MTRIALLFLLALLPALPAHAAAELRIHVEPRVEIASVMARLAGYEEYQAAGLPAYDAAVQAHFAPHASHPSIAVMRELRASHRIGYGAPLELALLADARWKPRLPLDPRPDWLDARWDPASARRFLDAARRFDRDTGAQTFFAGQRDVHAQAEAALAAALGPRLDLSWYRALPGAARAQFELVPTLLAGQNNYGPHQQRADGRRVVFGLIGTPTLRTSDPISYPAEAVLALLVHEFHHSFVNPWVDAHAQALMPAAGSLYAVVKPRMQSLAYGDPRILLYESLVRAQTQRYLRTHGEAAVLARVLAEDRGKGFPWVPALADLLEARAATGASTQDADAAAQVAALLQDWARDGGARVHAEERRLADERLARLQAGPQVVTYAPAQGARVAPGDGVLEVRFDRPMAPALAIFGEVPEVIGKPAWSDDGTTLRIPVRFAAGGAYRLLLNTEEALKMRSRADEPLAPREWEFSVGD